MLQLTITDRTVRIAGGVYQLSQIAAVRTITVGSDDPARVKARVKALVKAILVIVTCFLFGLWTASFDWPIVVVFLSFVAGVAALAALWQFLGLALVKAPMLRKCAVVLDGAWGSELIVITRSEQTVREVAALIAQAMETPPRETITYPLRRHQVPRKFQIGPLS